MFRVLDLFSGIGGFSLGLERTGGFKTVAFCEIDPFCRRVLAKHWPEVPIYEDVRSLTADALARDRIAVDIIAGGFPCQDLSRAGTGAGIHGPQSGQWGHFARLIGELRPQFVLLENVAALLDGGMATVCGDLASLGYDAEWDVISACALGAAHMRQRVFLVAYPNSIYGRKGLRNTVAHQHRPLQAVYDLEGARACVRARLENPSALYGGADDAPDRMDRNRAIGNSIYWQIPNLIGCVILDKVKETAA